MTNRVKFQRLSRAKGGERWFARRDDGAQIEYGWSYSSTGTNEAFVPNAYTYCDAFARVWRDGDWEDVFRKIVNGGVRTYSDARTEVRSSGALAEAKAAAIVAVLNK